MGYRGADVGVWTNLLATRYANRTLETGHSVQARGYSAFIPTTFAPLFSDIAKLHYHVISVELKALFFGSTHKGTQSMKRLTASHITFLERDAAALNGLAQDLDCSHPRTSGSQHRNTSFEVSLMRITEPGVKARLESNLGYFLCCCSHSPSNYMHRNPSF